MFENRFDAAQKLVPYLQEYKNKSDAIIIAIPRGGLQLGYVLAKELNLPLDIVLTKKIGYPGNPEYAIGAVSLEHLFISPDYINFPGFDEYIKQQTSTIRKLLNERVYKYRGNKPPLNLKDKIVIVVDDGVATGNTLIATLALIKQDQPKKIIVALPVGSQEAIENLKKTANAVICLEIPQIFFGVSQFYNNFDQVDDQEAIELLHGANK